MQELKHTERSVHGELIADLENSFEKMRQFEETYTLLKMSSQSLEAQLVDKLKVEEVLRAELAEKEKYSNRNKQQMKRDLLHHYQHHHHDTSMSFCQRIQSSIMVCS